MGAPQLTIVHKEVKVSKWSWVYPFWKDESIGLACMQIPDLDLVSCSHCPCAWTTHVTGLGSQPPLSLPHQRQLRTPRGGPSGATTLNPLNGHDPLVLPPLSLSLTPNIQPTGRQHASAWPARAFFAVNEIIRYPSQKSMGEFHREAAQVFLHVWGRCGVQWSAMQGSGCG